MERLLNNKLAEVLSFYFPNSESPTLLKKFKDNVFLVGLDGKKYVVKKYSPMYTPERLSFFEELQNFTSEKISVPPHVIATPEHKLNVQLGGYGYDLTEFVKSESFDKNKVKDVSRFFFDIGSFVGNLHSTFSEFENSGHLTTNSLLNIDPNTPGHMTSLLRDYEKAGIEESWVRIVRDKITMVGLYSSVSNSFGRLPQKIVHGDLYLKNILLDKDQRIVGLIDFAQAGTFFRCYEVMRAMVQTNRFFQNVDVDPLYLKNFLRGYLSKCHLDEIELKNMLDLYIYIQASDVSFLDLDTIKTGNIEATKYAKYRFDSLNSLHKNHQLLSKSIDELMHN